MEDQQEPIPSLSTPSSTYNFLPIIIAVVLSSVAAGGIVYFWQNGKSISREQELQKKIIELEKQMNDREKGSAMQSEEDSIVEDDNNMMQGEDSMSDEPTMQDEVSSKEEPVVDVTASWQKYMNEVHGFSFKYPANIIAYEAVDQTNGQIPDVAGFGYAAPGQYDPGNPAPDDKQGSSRILVWKNVTQDLKSFARADAAANSTWSDVIINGMQAIVAYSKDASNVERTPMTFKTYYLKQGNTVYQIMGFSVNNDYSEKWISLFDSIVQTFTVTL